jgi:hypothetical protein
MVEYIKDFSGHSLAALEYTRVNEEQAQHVRSVMGRPEYSKNFDVTFLPVETDEERQAAAQEWAAYREATSRVRARDMGAVALFDGRDDNSVESLLGLLENKDIKAEDGESRFTTHALMRVVKRSSGVNVFDLISGYYSINKG